MFDGSDKLFCPFAIGDIEARLDGSRFVRVHRSHIINDRARHRLPERAGDHRTGRRWPPRPPITTPSRSAAASRPAQTPNRGDGDWARRRAASRPASVASAEGGTHASSRAALTQFRAAQPPFVQPCAFARRIAPSCSVRLFAAAHRFGDDLRRAQNDALAPSLAGVRRRMRRRPGGWPMIPGSFAYHRPTSIKEAVELLAELRRRRPRRSPAGTA